MKTHFLRSSRKIFQPKLQKQRIAAQLGADSVTRTTSQIHIYSKHTDRQADRQTPVTAEFKTKQRAIKVMKPHSLSPVRRPAWTLSAEFTGPVESPLAAASAHLPSPREERGVCGVGGSRGANEWQPETEK